MEIVVPSSTPQPQTTSQSKRLALSLYFILAYGLTWLFWLPAAGIAQARLTLPVPPFVLMLLGGLGPMLAAIMVTAWEAGGQGVRALFAQVGRWRVAPFWYGIALIGIPLLQLPVFLAYVGLGGVLASAELSQQLASLPMLFLFIALVGGGLDEEMGWRGYALPRLQHLLSPLWANLFLGVVWACWHLPLWLIAGTAQAEMPFVLYLVKTTALSFLLGWIYNGTGGSLLLAILAHTASNVMDNYRVQLIGQPDFLLTLLVVQAVVTVVAAFVMVWFTRSRLTNNRLTENLWNFHKRG